MSHKKHRYPHHPILFDSPQAPVLVHIQRVVDGDTVVIDNDRTGVPEHIRLFGIDAPERDQAFGPEATRGLEEIVGEQPGGNVLLRRYGIDGYGRTLGSFSPVGDETADLNHEMIRRGWAWAYSKEHDRVQPPVGYYASQFTAQVFQRGLWAGKKPQKPSEFRAEKRERAAEKRRRRRHKNNPDKGLFY